MARHGWMRERQRLEAWSGHFEIPSAICRDMQALDSQITALEAGVDRLRDDALLDRIDGIAHWLLSGLRRASKRDLDGFLPLSLTSDIPLDDQLHDVVTQSRFHSHLVDNRLVVGAICALAEAEAGSLERHILCGLLLQLGDQRIERALTSVAPHSTRAVADEVRDCLPLLLVGLGALPPLINGEEFPRVAAWFDRCRDQPYWSDELAAIFIDRAAIGGRYNLEELSLRMDACRPAVEALQARRALLGPNSKHFPVAERIVREMVGAFLNKADVDHGWLSRQWRAA